MAIVSSTYNNFDEAPAKYQAESILRLARSEGFSEVGITARTAFRWLCGDQVSWGVVPEIYYAKRKLLHEAIKLAIGHGLKLSFILQCPKAAMPFFDNAQIILNRDHFMEALKAYHAIRSQMPLTADRARFSLKITRHSIQNSFVRFCNGNGQAFRLIFDLCEPRFISGNSNLKPFNVWDSDNDIPFCRPLYDAAVGDNACPLSAALPMDGICLACTNANRFPLPLPCQNDGCNQNFVQPCGICP